jgi:hypothetical protein
MLINIYIYLDVLVPFDRMDKHGLLLESMYVWWLFCRFRVYVTHYVCNVQNLLS